MFILTTTLLTISTYRVRFTFRYQSSELFTNFTQPVVTADFSVFREAAFNNEVYFYTVDNAQGEVDGLAPRGNTYRAEALNNIVKNVVTDDVVIFSTANQKIEAGSMLAALIIVNGNFDQLTDTNTSNNPTVYFPYIGANTDNVVYPTVTCRQYLWF